MFVATKIKKPIFMKKILTAALLLVAFAGFAQSGDVWPIYSRQEFDMDENFEITKEYEAKSVCGFFMFLNNNEFLHATDNITSLYKIISREETESSTVYKVVSEVGNVYTYSFSKTNKDVLVLTKKGYGSYYKCLAPYGTKVFDNINK